LFKKELNKRIKKNNTLLFIVLYGIFLNVLLHGFELSFNTIVDGLFLSTSSIGIYHLFRGLNENKKQIRINQKNMQ
jgi:hypothetical protein